MTKASISDCSAASFKSNSRMNLQEKFSLWAGKMLWAKLFNGTWGQVFWGGIHWQIWPKVGPTENTFRAQLGITESPFPAFWRQGMERMK